MRIRRLAIALLGLAGVASTVVALAQPASAQRAPARDHIDVIEVSGLVDPVVADFVVDALGAAEAGGALALVVQLDSGGGVLSQDRLESLLARVGRSDVPVGVWVGPSGASADGQAADLVEAADIAGSSPRSSVRGLEAAAARPRGVVDLASPTLGDFIVDLDGRDVGGRTLSTAEVVREGGEQPRRRPTVEVRFAKLGLVARLLHTAASPSVAYLLLVIGLLLVVFEFFTAGVGVAAAVGAGCLVLAGYGLDALPARSWAVALVVAGIVGYAVDLQAGAPRFWTAVGTVCLAVGTVRLIDGPDITPLAMVAGVGGTALALVSGMPAMVRARFSTPTIGRESMVGEDGTALSDISPEGVVEVRGAPWRARTNRATPITAGAAVRVAAIDGLLLEVEPPEGAARDHRDRRP